MALHLRGDVCPFCVGQNIRSGSVFAYGTQKSEEFTINECLDCTIAWQWPPVRTREDSVRYFDNEYAIREGGSYFDPDIRQQIAALELGFLSKLVDKPTSLLDVGCGDGTFVDVAARSGWIASGVDPAAPYRDGTGVARLIRGPLEKIATEEKFKIVTLWDVVEHVERPGEMIFDAAQHVARNGWVVVETGNYQCGGRLEAAKNWWNYQLDHRWYLAPDVLMALMSEAGLCDFVVGDSVNRPWWKGERQFRPWLRRHVYEVLRRPMRAVDELRAYAALMRCAKRWPEWSGLEIITIAGRRSSEL